MPYVTIRYERAKLYEEVWAEAVTTVAKRYGISDVALRKTCRNLAVPLPPLGYWAKLAAGKKLPTPPLPEHSGPTEIVRHRFVSSEPAEPDPEHLVARREFEAQPENQIVVPETLVSPHPLVVATERAFGRRKRQDPREVPALGRRCLDISVSDGSLPRALRIMDSLLKALDARKMPLSIVESESKRQSCVTLQGQNLAIRLAENISRVEREPTEKELQEKKKYGYVYLPNRYSFVPTSMLKLGIIGGYRDEFQKVVADGKRQRIENCLNEFVVKLEAEAVHRKREAERRERERLLCEERRRVREAFEERRRKELELLEALEEETQKWRRAENIRAYVAAVEARLERETLDPDRDSEIRQWIAWSRHKADWIDPIVAAPCPEIDGE